MRTARLFHFAFGDFQGEALGMDLGAQFIRLVGPIIDIVRYGWQKRKFGLERYQCHRGKAGDTVQALSFNLDIVACSDFLRSGQVQTCPGFVDVGNSDRAGRKPSLGLVMFFLKGGLLCGGELQGIQRKQNIEIGLRHA